MRVSYTEPLSEDSVLTLFREARETPVVTQTREQVVIKHWRKQIICYF